MRYPEFLQSGGRIGVAAPSFGAVMEPYHSMFLSAVKKFEADGYTAVIGPNCFESSGLGKSNTPEKCGKEINDFFLNDRSDVIISCGGGETMCEDLPYIDFKGISEAEPKWFMGFSDNTNLTALLPSLCDTAAIYGPCAASFGSEPRHKAVQDAFDLLTGKISSVSNYDRWEKDDIKSGNPLASYNATEPFEMNAFIPDGTDKAAFSGRLIGGCLDCLSIICGTQFDRMKDFAERYNEDGIIWFLEACDLNPMSIRRVIWQLDSAGWFKYTKGFLIGRPGMIEANGMGLDRFTAVTGILSKYNVPILMDLDIGHLPPMMPIISGAMADVTAAENSITLNYRFI